MEIKPTATLIKSLENFRGSAHLYMVYPPIGYDLDMESGEYTKFTSFVVVSAVVAAFGGPETFIFASNADGDVLDWRELEGSFRGAQNHRKALELAGYEVANARRPFKRK